MEKPAPARSPSWLLFWTEGARAVMDMTALANHRSLLSDAPEGDKHSVLVIPGFTVGDWSTRILRRFLRDKGYRAYGWGLGVNMGPKAGVAERLEDRTRQILAERREPISVIGQSLGGIYAREIARQLPEHIRQVITLGSPFRDVEGTRSNVRRIFQWTTGISPEEVKRRMDRDAMARILPKVPCTAIYSKMDGIAHWQSCVQKRDKSDKSEKSESADINTRAENLEVLCSHMGMGYHPSVLYAIADRLAQPADSWTPFVSSAGRLRAPALYPTPEPL